MDRTLRRRARASEMITNTPKSTLGCWVFFLRNDQESLDVCGSKAFYSRIIKRFFILYSLFFYSNALETCWNGLTRRTTQREENQFDKNSSRAQKSFSYCLLRFLLRSLLSFEILFSALLWLLAAWEPKPFKIAVAVYSPSRNRLFLSLCFQLRSSALRSARYWTNIFI